MRLRRAQRYDFLCNLQRKRFRCETIQFIHTRSKGYVRVHQRRGSDHRRHGEHGHLHRGHTYGASTERDEGGSRESVPDKADVREKERRQGCRMDSQAAPQADAV